VLQYHFRLICLCVCVCVCVPVLSTSLLLLLFCLFRFLKSPTVVSTSGWEWWIPHFNQPCNISVILQFRIDECTHISIYKAFIRVDICYGFNVSLTLQMGIQMFNYDLQCNSIFQFPVVRKLWTFSTIEAKSLYIYIYNDQSWGSDHT